MTVAAIASPRKKARIISGTNVEIVEDEDSPHTG